MEDHEVLKHFREVQASQLKFNPFQLIRGQSFLITAGDRTKANSMMANWGLLGYVWNRNVVELLVRPQRYTREFIDDNDRFTLSFFTKEWQQQMLYVGSHSGRDVDKYAETGLHLAYIDDRLPFVRESQFVMVCRKIYIDHFRPEGFLDPVKAKDYYEGQDYHVRYIAELERVLQHIDAEDQEHD